MGASGKESACQCRRCQRHGFDPWVGNIPGGGHGNPPQCPCLRNPVGRGAWQATVHGVIKGIGRTERVSAFGFDGAKH